MEPPLGIQDDETNTVFIYNNRSRMTVPRQKTHLAFGALAIHILFLSTNSLQAGGLPPLPIMITWNKDALGLTALNRHYLGIEPLSRLGILVLLLDLRQPLRVDVIAEKENRRLLGVYTRS